MNLNPIAKMALEEINFSKRFEAICIKYHKPKGVEKPDKKEILQQLKELGYDFKYAERCFIFIEYWQRDIKSHTVFNLKYGTFLVYFNVAINEKFIDLNSGNLGTMAYALENNIHAPGMPVFSSYDEFKEIAKEMLSIYEDFKKSFVISLNKTESITTS